MMPVNREFVDEVLNLGVILDSTVSWESQINQITKKVNKSLFGLRFIQPCTIQVRATEVACRITSVKN